MEAAACDGLGRPDQVYRMHDGFHVPVELKNRDQDRVYETDIAEISLRAWLLIRNGKKTTAYGYMAINSRDNGKRQAIRLACATTSFASS
jgi:CRISPR-associated exonuclease Cas4